MFKYVISAIAPLLFISSLFCQSIADVRYIEIEDGLNERIIKKIFRDSLGYFYFFQDHSVQRFDGEQFEAVQIDSDNHFQYDLVSTVFQNSERDIIINFVDQKDHYSIEAGALLAKKEPDQPITNSLLSSSANNVLLNEIELSHMGQDYIAKNGTIYKNENGILINLTSLENSKLKCILSKKDNHNNVVFVFNEHPNRSKKILMINEKGKVLDMSMLLEYNNNITDIYSDNFSNDWMLASFNGVIVIKLVNEFIHQYLVDPDLKKSQFGQIITGFVKNDDEILLLKEAKNIYSIRNQSIINLTPDKKTSDFFIRNQKIVKSKTKELFYSNSYHFDGTSDVKAFDRSFLKIKKEKVDLRIRDLFPLDNGELLVAGSKSINQQITSGQILKLSSDLSSTETILEDNDEFISINYLKKKNEFWIGTSNGILCIDSNLKFLRKIDLDKSVAIVIEYSGKILAGTLGYGIVTIDPVSNTTVQNTEIKDQLSDNMIMGMVKSPDNNLWVSTYNGLNVISPEFTILRKFHEHEGLPNREFNHKATAIDHEGKLFFGTLNGVLQLDPIKLLLTKKTNGIEIIELETFLNGKKKSFPLLENNSVNIPNEVDSILLTLNYPDYYKYKFDSPEEYITVRCNSIENISYSPEGIIIHKPSIGTHQIKLNNKFSSHSDSIDMEISYDFSWIIWPWSFVLFITLFSYFISKWLINKMKNEEQNKTILNNKIAELEITALRSQMNPHFIFNALGSIQYYIQTQEMEKADDYLSDFAMLIRKILESSKSKYITLKEEIELLSLYTKLEGIRFEGKFNTTIEIEDGVEEDFFIAPMIIQPFVENSINHGFSGVKRNGELKIIFSSGGENTVYCDIIDNGIGRKNASKNRERKHKSMGMNLIKERIELISKSSALNIEIKIKDLMTNQIPLGTSVRLKFHNKINNDFSY